MVNLEPCMAWWIGGMSEWRGLEVSPPYAESMNNEGKSAVSLSLSFGKQSQSFYAN